MTQPSQHQSDFTYFTFDITAPLQPPADVMTPTLHAAVDGLRLHRFALREGEAVHLNGHAYTYCGNGILAGVTDPAIARSGCKGVGRSTGYAAGISAEALSGFAGGGVSE